MNQLSTTTNPTKTTTKSISQQPNRVTATPPPGRDPRLQAKIGTAPLRDQTDPHRLGLMKTGAQRRKREKKSYEMRRKEKNKSYILDTGEGEEIVFLMDTKCTVAFQK